MAFIENSCELGNLVNEISLRQIIENAAVGIAQIDSNGHLLMVNKKFSEITGYTKEELLQKSFQEITNPDDLEADLKQAEALFRGDIPSYITEKRYVRKNGTYVWVKLTGSAIFDELGKFITFIGVIEDISEKKRAEEALHITEQYYKIASSAANIGAYFRNLETGENFWSPEFLKIYGLNPGDPFPLKNGIPEAVHPDDRKKVLQLAQQHYDSLINNEFSSDHRIILPDETIRWVNIRGVTELDLFNNPVKTYGIVMDITLRKKAEEAQQKTEEMFRLLANNMSQLAWMMENNGRIFWYNQRWFDYTGTTLEEMQGQGWQKVLHPNHSKRVVKSLRHSIESGEVWEELFPLKGKHGKYRWFLTRAIPLKDENGKLYRWLGTNTDVTHQRNIEKKLKNDSKLFEDLLYVAAHDLKGPVANMYGALDLMSRLPMEKKVMFLDRFRDLADQLNITIQGVTGILSIQNDDKIVTSAINAEKLLDKIQMEFKQPKDFSIKCNIEKPNIFYVDLYLYSIIKNLVSNAIKFRRKNVPLIIEITIQSKDEFTLLTVCDNGIGIDLESYGKKLFLPFHRLHPKKTKGTGVGLYLIKGVIEKNGGYITVESTPGKGTKFNCYLKEY